MLGKQFSFKLLKNYTCPFRAFNYISIKLKRDKHLVYAHENIYLLHTTYKVMVPIKIRYICSLIIRGEGHLFSLLVKTVNIPIVLNFHFIFLYFYIFFFLKNFDVFLIFVALYVDLLLILIIYCVYT